MGLMHPCPHCHRRETIAGQGSCMDPVCRRKAGIARQVGQIEEDPGLWLQSIGVPARHRYEAMSDTEYEPVARASWGVIFNGEYPEPAAARYALERAPAVLSEHGEMAWYRCEEVEQEWLDLQNRRISTADLSIRMTSPHVLILEGDIGGVYEFHQWMRAVVGRRWADGQQTVLTRGEPACYPGKWEVVNV